MPGAAPSSRRGCRPPGLPSAGVTAERFGVYLWSPLLGLVPFFHSLLLLLWSRVPLSPEGCLASGASVTVLPARCFPPSFIVLTVVLCYFLSAYLFFFSGRAGGGRNKGGNITLESLVPCPFAVFDSYRMDLLSILRLGTWQPT